MPADRSAAETPNEQVERAIAAVATNGTIVCQCCNASDVTDDDHRRGCPVWELRAAITDLAAAGAPTTERSLDVQLIIDHCESHAAVLSMPHMPFQVEQAVDFLVATVPAALRRLAAAVPSTEPTDELIADLRADLDAANAEIEKQERHVDTLLERARRYREALEQIAEAAEMWLSHDMWPPDTTDLEKVAADARARVIRDAARAVLEDTRG